MAKSGVDKENKNKKTRLSVLNDDQAVKPKGQGSHAVRKIDTVEYQELVERVLGQLKLGYRSNEVFADLLSEGVDITQEQFFKLIPLAYKLFENDLHKDREYIFQIHMSRYEQIFQNSMLMVDSWNRPLDAKQNRDHWPIMCAKYINAIKALENKEKLLGLHDKSIIMEFNEGKATIVEKENMSGAVPGIDLSKLDLEELKELFAFIEEARTIPIEGVHRVVLRKTVIEVNEVTGDRMKKLIEERFDDDTIDTWHDELPADVVSKFEDITPKEEEIKVKEIAIDSRPEKARGKGKTVDDIREDLLKGGKTLDVADMLKNKLSKMRKKKRAK